MQPDQAGIVSGQPRTSRAAKWSLICGILSFLCLPAIPAIILGIIALVAINDNKGKLRGTGLAIAGIVTAVLIPIVMIPVISIIAAFAIPNLLTARTQQAPVNIWTADEEFSQGQNDEIILTEQMAANEKSAVALLKLLVSAEAIWRQQDPDGNGIKDYWTYDISCLHRMLRADGTTKVAFIPSDYARADVNTAEFGDFGESVGIEDWSDLIPEPKNGYYFQAMELDETGAPYSLEEVGETGIKAANKTKFGFVAYPAEYGQTGRQTFIVNEQGMIYAIGINPDIYGVALKWPGNDDSGDPYAQSNWKVAE